MDWDRTNTNWCNNRYSIRRREQGRKSVLVSPNMHNRSNRPHYIHHPNSSADRRSRWYPRYYSCPLQLMGLAEALRTHWNCMC